MPLQPIGHGAQPRPHNFFAETDRWSSAPPNMPAGIDFSNLTHCCRPPVFVRTQPRLGGPNFARIDQRARCRSTIAARTATCPDAGAQRPRELRAQQPAGRQCHRSLAGAGLSPCDPATMAAAGRHRPESFADHCSRGACSTAARARWSRRTAASALVFELSKVETLHVREAVVGQLLHADPELAQRVAAGLGLQALPPPHPPPSRCKTCHCRPRCASSTA